MSGNSIAACRVQFTSSWFGIGKGFAARVLSFKISFLVYRSLLNTTWTASGRPAHTLHQLKLSSLVIQGRQKLCLLWPHSAPHCTNAVDLQLDPSRTEKGENIIQFNLAIQSSGNGNLSDHTAKHPHFFYWLLFEGFFRKHVLYRAVEVRSELKSLMFGIFEEIGLVILH